MKRFSNLISSLLVILSFIGLTACTDDVNNSHGEGCLSMKMNIAMPQAGASMQQLKQDDANALADSCRVRIYGSNGLVRYYKGMNNVPSELWLAAGDYRVAVQTGDSVPARFNMGFYKGETNIIIKAGGTTTATLTCKVINTLVTVALTDELKSILSDYEVTVSSAEASLTYTAQHVDSIGYFILPADDNTLNWTITGKKTDGNTYTQSGTLSNVKAAMKYELRFDFNETEFIQGGAYFNLIVNETAIEKIEEIVIYKHPDIIGNGFDIDKPVVYELNAGIETSVWINASSAISQLVVSGSNLTSMGLPDNSIDFTSAASNVLTDWANAGLTYRYEYNATKDISSAKLVFSETLVRNLPEGNYDVNIRVADMHAKEWSKTLTFTISNAVVLTEQAIRSDIWAKRATLRGTLMKSTTEALSFQYRAKGTDVWYAVDAELNGTNITAQLEGLTSGTTYEYRAVAGTMPSSVIAEFTTESEFVIPNAGFENWHKSGKVWLVYGSNESMWWDTGNHGSATLNVNITTQDTNLKHSGNSSIKMQSQFVSLMGIGKFAAGNVFSGVYSGTDGTNGILDFGRPMSSRPSKLQGYYKYITGTVDYSDIDEMPKGSTDKGNIYIAVGDWDAPVHITTKDHTIFDKNDPHVIGFGEIVSEKNTEGEGLIPFSIDIEYRSTNRIPTYIVIVASASYYGDYFTGSSSSTMWLDDLELIYE